MKNICHVLIAFGNKNQNYTTALLNSLNNLSSSCHFVYCHAKLEDSRYINIIQSKSLSRWKSYLLIFKLSLRDSKFKKLYHQIGYTKIYKWLLLINQEIDVIHVHHMHIIPVEILDYFKSKNVNIIVSLRGRDLLLNTKNEKNYLELLNKLELASSIHTISNYMACNLKSRFQFSCEVIYRGIVMPEKENIKKTNPKSNSIKAIAVGRLVWEKGHIYLLESIIRLIKKGQPIELDIFGDGPLLEFLNFRINQLGLENNIALKGYVANNKLKTLYKNYNVALQPSLSEALSNGLMDFMVHNLPCVVSSAGGMNEIIVHGENGFVFNILNPSEIDDYIIKAANMDFKKLKAFNDTYKNKFDHRIEVKKLDNLYV
jgi:glycosyltransferase involved in cell wall biosynthesis